MSAINGISADVIALQEVMGNEIKTIREDHKEHRDGGALFSQEVHTPTDPEKWMGCALLLPHDTHVLEAGVVGALPKPIRGLWARAELPEQGLITLVSWQTPSENRKTKMNGYRAMNEWLAEAPRPLAICADLNTWNDPVDLERADPSNAWFEELDFVGLRPRHGLADAHRIVLERQGGLAARRRRRKDTDRPLDVSHVSKGGKPYRFDRIYISSELDPLESAYRPMKEATDAGSDHAVHWVDLDDVQDPSWFSAAYRNS